MNKQEFLRLLDKYLEGRATEVEEQILYRYYEEMQLSAEWNEAELGSAEEMEARMLLRLQHALAQKARVVPLYRHRWFKTAAAALVVLLAGSWMWGLKEQPDKLIQAKTSIAPKKMFSGPGGKVTLTLADGRVWGLDGIAGGEILRQSGVSVSKQQDELVYTASGSGKTAAYHQLSTARGVRYQVVLSDGSKVILNASTSLRYPAHFPANERRVEVDGEAYFEVAHDAHRPFRVVIAAAGKARGSMVEVLGTHFNVNAYEDEAEMRTTLLEGSVVVHPALAMEKVSGFRVLKPGQQAQVAGSKTIEVRKVDVKNVLAWKDNLFHFAGADTQEVMRQLARWYDLDVVYKGRGNGKRFTGKFSRMLSIKDVLDILEHSGWEFDVYGRKITVRQ